LILGKKETNLNINLFPTWPLKQKSLYEYVKYFSKKIDFFNTDAINAINIIHEFNIDNYINLNRSIDDNSDDEDNIDINIQKENIDANIQENIAANVHENIDSNVQENIDSNI